MTFDGSRAAMTVPEGNASFFVDLQSCKYSDLKVADSSFGRGVRLTLVCGAEDRQGEFGFREGPEPVSSAKACHEASLQPPVDSL